jgi:hypothetical protein
MFLYSYSSFALSHKHFTFLWSEKSSVFLIVISHWIFLLIVTRQLRLVVTFSTLSKTVEMDVNTFLIISQIFIILEWQLP